MRDLEWRWDEKRERWVWRMRIMEDGKSEG